LKTPWLARSLRLSDAWVLAGGLDSFDWLKDRIKRPKFVVDLSQIKELRGIREASQRRDRDRRHDHADRSGAQSDRQGEVQHLSKAPKLAASPQIRNQGTIGGNVSQDARCWYYRSGWKCYRAGGNICFADTPTAINREHAILGRGPLRGRQSRPIHGAGADRARREDGHSQQAGRARGECRRLLHRTRPSTSPA
jgi:hypothetical protein